MPNRPRATTAWRSTPTSTAPPASACPASPSTAPISSPSTRPPARSSRRAREGGGPALLECKMIRFYGHFEGDAQTYRGKGELDDIRANHDCMKKFARRVTEAGVVSADELAAIDREVLGLIEDAVAAGQGGAAADRGRPDSPTSTSPTDSLGAHDMARKISMKQAINEALDQEMARDPTVIMMGEDIVGGAGGNGEMDAWGGVLGVTKGLYAKHGDRAARHAPWRERLHRRGDRRGGLRHAPGGRADVRRLHGRVLRPDLQPGRQVQVHVRRQGRDAGGHPHHGRRGLPRGGAAHPDADAAVHPHPGTEGGLPVQRLRRQGPADPVDPRQRSGDLLRAQEPLRLRGRRARGPRTRSPSARPTSCARASGDDRRPTA